MTAVSSASLNRGRGPYAGANAVLKYKSFATHLLVGAVCFYFGIGIGVRVELLNCPQKDCDGVGAGGTPQQSELEFLQRRISESQMMLENTISKQAAEAKCERQIQQICGAAKKNAESNKAGDSSSATSDGKRFPDNVSYFATGLGQVDRDKFTARFDVGVPLDASDPNKNDRVLILYNDRLALPDDNDLKEQIVGNGDIPLIDDLDLATKNCDVLDLVLVQQKTKQQCFALMGQYQSFHIQKFMRLPEAVGEKLNHDAPLRLVNRGAQSSGRLSAKPPSKDQTLTYWSTLKTYLDTLESVLAELAPIAEKVAKQNTVIVMVCNHGQSELLMNFVCAAKSRNLDLSPVLVFATDEETKELAEGLGLAAFFDKTNYGSAPKQAARSYGDKAFTAMMMAKVYCVQMIAMLGYDVLFQDVDMVWFKDPLQYFHDPKSPSHGFDVYFQDDGSRSMFYAPFSANTGFYYVRANDRTRNFFNTLLMSGDLVISSKSHQIALVALLSEHSSLHGMKTKVLSRDTDEFPGGHAFHYRKDFMRSFFKGEVEPYIFHMSWTLNKDNKQKFFRQLGEWYLKDKCVSATVSDILGTNEKLEPGALIEPCCSAEAIFSCSYSDKPSKLPCKDSPPIDKGGKSFW